MIALLDWWLAVARSLSRAAVRGGGAMLLASAFLIGIDVFGRKLLGTSIGGSDEIAGYAFAVATSWSLSFTLLERANVRVDALYVHLPEAVTVLLDLVGLLALGLLVALLAWFGGTVLRDSLLFSTRATTPLATPLWIPQSLWLIGFLFFLFAWLPLVLRVALALIGGDRARVRELAGARTLDEDARAESEHTRNLAPLRFEGGR